MYTRFDFLKLLFQWPLIYLPILFSGNSVTTKKTYEYLIVTVGITESLSEVLDKHGKQGWQLTTRNDKAFTESLSQDELIFMREGETN